jgi:RNA polymerase sigma factor (sigma-70 family)
MNPVTDLLQHVRRIVSLPEGATPTDGQLLDAFIRLRDSQALEVLVRRHAAMVWGICRRRLAHHDAEDAFQATFLVLVRKAASIRSRDLLANWLFRVAYQTARKAWQVAAKRSRGQVMPMPDPQVQPREGVFGPELRAVLDQELSRLPDKYQIAIVLCDLEGKSRSEAAELLGLPQGTVASRLARGRAMLGKRLLRRGVGGSAVSLTAALAEQAAWGAVPAAWLAGTIKVATLLAAGVTEAGAISAEVSTLMDKTLKTMALAKYKAAGLVLLMVALVAFGGMVTYDVLANQSSEPRGSAAIEPPKPSITPEDIKKFGSEADARRQAEEMVAASCAAIPGFPELLQQIRPGWKELAGKSSAVHKARSQYGSLEAKLDREKGEWIVTGVSYFGDVDVGCEVDWKAVVKYTVLPDPKAGRGPPRRDQEERKTSTKEERHAGGLPLPEPASVPAQEIEKSARRDLPAPTEELPSAPIWGWIGVDFHWLAPNQEELPTVARGLVHASHYGLRLVRKESGKGDGQ